MVRLDQDLGRDAEAPVEVADHLHGEGTLAVQDFR